MAQQEDTHKDILYGVAEVIQGGPMAVALDPALHQLLQQLCSKIEQREVDVSPRGVKADTQLACTVEQPGCMIDGLSCCFLCLMCRTANVECYTCCYLPSEDPAWQHPSRQAASCTQLRRGVSR